ncbi:NmrA/HSCARG family protein [Staphylococcus kloosii]|uniref:NmrA/HSCARG family protein n=1 Tax=Staphylococcus kloosii TaxID=29384 RepID=UPI0028A3C863|nr:NmrA/HSCARG family protein [Staphylococcus kloosii]MDT3959945.1 NmrA/HSCARG family protein [Staphylococcus kloosii]
MNTTSIKILVTGATGTQGSAVVEQAINNGLKVRALVRDKNSAKAQALSEKGVELIEGDLENQKSLENAMQGMYGVFGVTTPSDENNRDQEIKQVTNLVEAAINTNIQHFVQSSVARAGEHEDFEEWGSGYWFETYWINKAKIEQIVKHSELTSWTILKPAFMMENWLPYRASHFFPHLKDDVIKSAFGKQTNIDVVSAIDVGKFAIASFEQSKKFNNKIIELATESLTIDEIANKINEICNRNITVESLEPVTAIKEGIRFGIVRAQEWNNVEGYQVDIQKLNQYNISMTTFSEWLKLYKNEF